MVPRLGLASLALAVLTYVGAAQVASLQGLDGKSSVDSAKVKEEVTLKEKQIAAKFVEFEQYVLKLSSDWRQVRRKPIAIRQLVLDRVLEACSDRSDLGEVREDPRVPQDEEALLDDRHQGTDDATRPEGRRPFPQTVVAMLREDTCTASRSKPIG